VDHVFEISEIPHRPIKVSARSRVTRCGGPAATAAVACTALNVGADLWSCIGQDSEGDFVFGRLAHHKVGLATMRRVAGVKTVAAFVLVDDSGERLIVAHGSAALPRTIEHLPLSEVAKAGAVLVDSTWPTGTVALLDTAAAARVPAVIDAEESNPGALTEILTHPGLPVFSEGAFTNFAGGATPDFESCKAVAAQLGKDFGVTLGGKGSLWSIGGDLLHVPALSVTVRDTTGAGDVFHGAMAAALADRMDLPQAARFASAAAGLKCASGNGWDGMPCRADVDWAMRKLE
jgi:sulfofructose kinase